MRLILSRKGFDSLAGGCPSPIFPDGTLYSLPIPDKKSKISYGELKYQDINIGDLINDLTGDTRRARHFAHLDPDIRADAYPRRKGWRPVLGQTSSSQSHLRNQNVQAGDLFLFFGLFRKVEKFGHRWRFVENSQPLHCLWGWLQIGEIIKVDSLSNLDLEWARYHPHFQIRPDANNTLYLACDNLSFLRGVDIPAAGVFKNFNQYLQLTNPDSKLPSKWRLPLSFYPSDGKPQLSYHSKIERWQRDDQYCYLDSVSRGQEFVIDIEGSPNVSSWFEILFINQRWNDAISSNVLR